MEVFQVITLLIIKWSILCSSVLVKKFFAINLFVFIMKRWLRVVNPFIVIYRKVLLQISQNSEKNLLISNNWNWTSFCPTVIQNFIEIYKGLTFFFFSQYKNHDSKIKLEMKKRKQSVGNHSVYSNNAWICLNEASEPKCPGGDSSAWGASLQDLHHQPVLQTAQFAAVILLQDCVESQAKTAQTRQRAAVRHIQQRVEEVLPEISVNVPERQRQTERERMNITFASKCLELASSSLVSTWSSMHWCYLLNTPFVLQTPPSSLTCMYVPNSIQ